MGKNRKPPAHRVTERTIETRKEARPRRHFLRSVVAARPVLQAGEPVRVRAKLRRDAPNDLLTRVGGAEGTERYVSFATPGTHRVPITVHHRDGRIDRTEIEFEVTPNIGPHPYPILQIRQEPTNPFLLLVSLKNAEEVYRDGVTFEWRVDGYGAFSTPRPFFVIDCERFINPTDETIPFDLHFIVNYPGRIQRTASESFRVWNDYAWSKARGVLKPRLLYDYRARGHRKELSANCVMVNDDDEYIEITGRNCGECHTPITATGEPDSRYYLAGHVAGSPVPSPTSFMALYGEGIAYARNLTPDPETGLGRWTVEDFRRVLRQGIGRNGQPLNRNMPWNRFNRFFSDVDIEAVWIYLRSLPPVRNEVPESTPFTPRP